MNRELLIFSAICSVVTAPRHPCTCGGDPGVCWAMTDISDDWKVQAKNGWSGIF